MVSFDTYYAWELEIGPKSYCTKAEVESGGKGAVGEEGIGSLWSKALRGRVVNDTLECTTTTRYSSAFCGEYAYVIHSSFNAYASRSVSVVADPSIFFDEINSTVPNCIIRHLLCLGVRNRPKTLLYS